MTHPLSVVLVRTLYPSNLGSASRAMVNMGFTRLVNVEPLCEITTKAHQMAAGAQGPLENRIVYSSWDEFYASEGEGVRIGLTRRSGQHRPVTDLAETLKQYLTGSEEEKQFSRPVYLIFGPENNGLQSNETLLFQHCCSIPTFGEMGSINLAQAVLLALFITRQVLQTPPELCRREKNLHHGAIPVSFERPKPLNFPEMTLRNWLEALGLDVSSPRVNALSFMKRLLGQIHVTGDDLRQLESILQQNIRKLTAFKTEPHMPKSKNDSPEADI